MLPSLKAMPSHGLTKTAYAEANWGVFPVLAAFGSEMVIIASILGVDNSAVNEKAITKLRELYAISFVIDAST
jgi:hypothetical protein